MKRTRAILTLALPTALIAALALTSCSASDGGDGAAAPECAPAGDASKSVKVEGDLGGTLTMTAETPLVADGIERSVLIEGEGDVAANGQGVATLTTVYNGATGDLIQVLPLSGNVVADEAPSVPWDAETVKCAVEGQRSVLVGNAEAFGLQAESLGITAEDNLVFVSDVLAVKDLHEKAEGEKKTAPEGLPGVTLDDKGAPSISLVDGAEPPTELEIATLIQGDGEEVAAGDLVFVNYSGWLWNGEEFDSSWSRGAPTAFTTDGVIPGFKDALEGQKVGSQVISVVPSDQGYQDGETRIFVLDILGTVHLPETK